ncbi:hypothetical protein [Roseibium sp.]|uniref:hypothetical protein n=1 Tax=Roseibium sp. TaxID=1936156 RepID=UPI003BAA9A56
MALSIARVGAFDAARLDHEDVIAPDATPATTCHHMSADAGTRINIGQVVDFALHGQYRALRCQIEDMNAGLLGQFHRIVMETKSLHVLVQDTLNIVPAVVRAQAPDIIIDVIRMDRSGCQKKQRCRQNKMLHTKSFKTVFGMPIVF